ncbi:MAG: AmmeMemoRadiSam system radical SAM enzyme [Candidatus Wallbacteria bacterium GWC2_49_35]|uniref:AmmeMemoRadiSam system radical SAM enzyme n=1 Tax=Candidatus Wallbacteria bacterium GWC2_49_35 TaxID=1817813 RepID=A0A1F7WIK1_9BACT|nr:MAG: AmmeMemoRadiSam system radical SAM enzyme [Candidatus Wallbacteria bacterium GWC2_49_35]
MNADKVPARHFERIAGGDNVRCLLCSHRCVIAPGKKGFCRSRANEGGSLYALNYGRACAVNIDPIEKKPLHHFLPSTPIVSIGTNFCNFSCKFCQNYEISQYETPTVEISAAKLLELIRGESGCASLAYTYNEPVIWYEFVMDTAKTIRENSYKTVLVTNGDISKEAFVELAPHIDAMNIDLKAFDKKFYSEMCSGSLESVCATIETAYKRGIVVELTNLLIPGLNDSDRMINDLVDFAASVSSDIPLHFSRYHPAYKMDIPATPAASLHKAFAIASKKMKFVYLGNIADGEKNSTFCPGCAKMIIKRINYFCDPAGIGGGGVCRYCGEKIYGNFYNCGD